MPSSWVGTSVSPTQWARPATITLPATAALPLAIDELARPTGVVFGPLTVHTPTFLGPTGLVGRRRDTFGEYWFERIHLLPTSKPLGSILSAITFPLEVWSAFRDQPETLLDVTLNGILVSVVEGVAVTDPYGVPLVYRPLQARDYTVTVAATGAPAVDVVITYQFASIPDPAIEVTGTRLVLFSPRIDWAQGFKDTLAWLTDVLTADDDSEQRIQLRSKPRRTLAFTVWGSTSERRP